MPLAFTLSVSFWSDQFVNGLTTGSLYALIALGYTMVYGVLKMINFAHGEVFMLGSFAGYGALVVMGGNELSGPIIALAILGAVIVAMAASVSASVVIERLAYRPLRNAPRLAPLISAIGVSIFLQYLVLEQTSARAKFYPDIFPRGSVAAGPFAITYIQLFLIASSVAMMAVLYTIIQRTRLGRAIRAVAENPTNASLMGVDVNRTIVFVFILGAAMAGVAGVLYGLFFQTIRGSMGFIPGIKAFTAAVLGGIGSIPGAMAGGYALGLAETVGRELLNELPGIDLGNQWRDVIAFTLLVAILIFRPTGIFAQRSTTRA
ncbi:branched-chain amino acid ABC transporter permease [Tepidiforma thermophila]|uniref:Branched-chain amino acid transport system permease protein n=1 Tax=Tepidiforma thermophila (strain KCTC 52669 / CGMCC 1.13589 / G233) TaxID=2761530 RepID=A0A2A9HIX8_TEPT2|nr:branched-chain amino acid ABC transporter permease [Tepidiforma thermophila]PFG75132.1 branched-chain amino acid transport system permease protein [Tepidiforma thermophila]